MTLRIAPDLALPIDAATGTFGILATKGAGKSNAAVVMAEEMYDAGIPWVAIDPKGDWWGVRSSGDGKSAGLPLPVFGGRHGDVPLEPTAGAMLADLVLAERLTCVLDVSQFTKADTTRFLLAFGQRLFRHADDDGGEPLHLFLEEAHEYLPQVVKGDQAELVGMWQRIVKQGRFKGLGCTLISQRSSVLNKDVLELIDTLIVLRTIGPRSRDSIKAWVQDQEVDPKLMASLPSLADGEAWVWSPGALRILQKIRFRRRRTFDSGATPKVGQARRPPSTLADVDLAAIKEQMAETIEKAKADDPKELRRCIAELERAVRDAEKATPEPIVESVEIEVVPPGFYEALDSIEGRIVGINEALDVLLALRGLRVATDRPDRAERKAPTPPASRQRDRGDIPARARPAGAAPDESLPKGEALILTAVAQHGQAARDQLSILTGYKRSTRDAYIQRLKDKGYVELSGSMVVATDTGLDVLGDDFESLPTGAQLQSYWLDRLPEGEGKILAVVLDAYPDGVHRDDISERTGYKRSTRDAYIQRLKARRLVTTDGEVRAADVLFEDL